jgi:hypothetical protein
MSLFATLSSLRQISLNVNLESFPLFTMFAPSWIYFSHLVIYLIHGRAAGYLPTISETGTGDFGERLQSRAFPTISLTTMYTTLSITWAVFADAPRATHLRTTAFVLATIGSLLMIVTGCCDLVNHHFPHFASCGGGLSMMIIWQLVLYTTIFNTMSAIRKVTRMCYVVIEAVGLAMIQFAQPIFGDRECVTIATLAEYSVLFFLQCFYLSFYDDIRGWQPVLAVIADRPNCE